MCNARRWQENPLDSELNLAFLPGFNDKHVAFAYNLASQLTGLDRYAAADATNAIANTSYAYDPTSRLSQMEHRQGAPGLVGTLLAGYGYSYDAGHRLTAIDFLPSIYDGEDVTYTYDPRNQLDTADYEQYGFSKAQQVLDKVECSS